MVINEWVNNGGAFVGMSGQRLKRAITNFVYGRSFHSHLSERVVNIGNRVVHKHGKAVWPTARWWTPGRPSRIKKRWIAPRPH